MTIYKAGDGSVILTDDANQARREVLDGNDPQLDAKIAAFFGPPPRRLIPKEVVEDRLEKIGKLDPALAILAGDPVKSMQWQMRNWPNVYFDDPGLLYVLGQAGLTAEEIAAVTAPWMG